MELDSLAVIGLTIVGAYLGSKAVQRIGIPQVVGFIVVGLLLGTSFLNVIPLEMVQELGFISEIALGLIGFEIGSHLRFEELRRMGPTILAILLGEAVGTFLLVTAGVYLLTGSDYTALIFGALAAATAPAATVDVLAEYRAKGPLTTTLLAVVGMDDVLALLLFSLAAALAESLLAKSGGLSLQQVVALPLREIGGALLLGVGIGLPFEWLLDRLKGRHAVYAYIVGTVLLVAGLANSIHASLILATMTMGIVITNIGSDNSEYVACVVERVGPLAYTLFFALVGARFQITLLPQMGVLGLLYIVLRTAGKFGGAWLGGWVGRAPRTVRDNLGLGLLSQAGVAVGLALSVANRFDIYGPVGAALGQLVVNVITATTFVVQMVGPVMVKLAITRAGEIGRGTAAEEEGIAPSVPCPDNQCASGEVL
ncbi:MAG TPA: cation:proton antiporter [Chloroflexi bacterium]|nr:cation:proton antiporter [Chloroflexota bacterium]